jgi:hypothetical protein
MRILALWFPRLPIQVLLRQHPELHGRTAILLQGHGDDGLVAACTPGATALGVVPGVLAGQARLRCPGARFLPDNARACLDELDRLAAIIRTRATIPVAIGGRDYLEANVTALAADLGEAQAVARLLELARAWTGYDVRAAVAGTRLEALEAARATRRGPAFVPASAESLVEPPIARGTPGPIRASARLPVDASPLSAREALFRLLGRLDVILAGRAESFRELRVTFAGTDGSARSLTVRPAHPLHAATAALEALGPRLPADAFEDCASLSVELGRLGPDTRVRPSAVAAGRGVRGAMPPAARAPGPGRRAALPAA